MCDVKRRVLKKSLKVFGLRKENLEKTVGGAWLGEKISSSVGHITFLSGDVKEAAGCINMDFKGKLQAGGINLGNISKKNNLKLSY